MKLVAVVLFLLLIFSFSREERIICDEVIQYPDTYEYGEFRQGGMVCEVFLKEGNGKQYQERGITKKDRI